MIVVVMTMAASRDHHDYSDDSQGVARRILRSHRPPDKPVSMGRPAEAPKPSDDRYTPVQRIPRAPMSERARHNIIADIPTARLAKPLDSLTPTRLPMHLGKFVYDLKMKADLLHGGFHAMRAVFGSDGGGVIRREDGVALPTGTGLKYENEIAHYHLALAEMIQLVVCALDAHGTSPEDAGRLIEQIARDLASQPTPPQEGA
jgi:hypothetical protein